MVSNYADPRYGTIQKIVYNRYATPYTDNHKFKPEKSMEWQIHEMQRLRHPRTGKRSATRNAYNSHNKLLFVYLQCQDLRQVCPVMLLKEGHAKPSVHE
jgi:hypothetical protein